MDGHQARVPSRTVRPSLWSCPYRPGRRRCRRRRLAPWHCWRQFPTPRRAGLWLAQRHLLFQTFRLVPLCCRPPLPSRRRSLWCCWCQHLRRRQCHGTHGCGALRTRYIRWSATAMLGAGGGRGIVRTAGGRMGGRGGTGRRRRPCNDRSTSSGGRRGASAGTGGLLSEGRRGTRRRRREEEGQINAGKVRKASTQNPEVGPPRKRRTEAARRRRRIGVKEVPPWPGICALPRGFSGCRRLPPPPNWAHAQRGRAGRRRPRNRR